MNLEQLKQLAEESWEGCDGCTEQDEVIYKNGYVKGYNSAISELPKEISDEEIEKEVMDSMDYVYLNPNDSLIFHQGWMRAIKWYREQLRKISAK
ncbi:hypothetical protein UFOVP208_51 [uncultured Caudovirales phage]|uniref:Uncharacterized protein n=1 Tax=uncultured Caudovirales phage TaxID=2100421 RepID=A0A6J7WN26_9CAUD|nr:hypothetical protein UFOVP208_51 [uncultured Caudovirales phage]